MVTKLGETKNHHISRDDRRLKYFDSKKFQLLKIFIFSENAFQAENAF